MKPKRKQKTRKQLERAIYRLKCKLAAKEWKLESMTADLAVYRKYYHVHLHECKLEE